MDPFTAALIALTYAGVMTWSAVDSHRQQKANAKSQENLERYNAQVAAAEAAREEKEASANAARQLEEDRRLRAHQRALYGASGAALATGSPLAVLGQTAADQQLQVADIMRGGSLAYRKGQSDSQNSLYRAKVAAGSRPSTAALAGSLMSIAGSSLQLGMSLAGPGGGSGGSGSGKGGGGGSGGTGGPVSNSMQRHTHYLN